MLRKLLSLLGRSRGLILTTYDHTSPIYKSDVVDGRSAYGLVYSKVLEGLKEEGWVIESVDVPSQVHEINNYLHLAERLQEIVSQMEERNPNIVFHDPRSFKHQLWHMIADSNSGYSKDTIDLSTKVTSNCLEERIYSSFRGRIERVESGFSWKTLEGNTAKKGDFYAIAEQLGVPIPQTIFLMSNDDPLWDYEALAQSLNGSRKNGIIMKAYSGHGGEDVYMIKNQTEFDTFLRETRKESNYWIAQERIPLPNDVPYSIRVIMWGDTILSAALLCNPNDEYRSNAKKGGIALDLGVPWSIARTSDSKLPENFDVQKLREIADVCGIDLEKRRLPTQAAELAKIIGGHPAAYLLKGIDLMYQDGNPIALEVNPHPGPPGVGMYSSVFGLSKRKRSLEVGMATELIGRAINGYL